MYVEKNGFVIMQKQEMSFLAGSGIGEDEFYFDDDINEAIVFDCLCEAKEALSELPLDKYEILSYEKTIFLSATEELERHVETDSTETCECDKCADLSDKPRTFNDGWGNEFQIKFEGSE